MSEDNTEVPDYGDRYNPEDYTVEIKLRFRNKEAMRDFTAGMCDGWGEGVVDMHWPWRQGIQFHETDTYCVDVWDEDQQCHIGEPEYKSKYESDENEEDS